MGGLLCEGFAGGGVVGDVGDGVGVRIEVAEIVAGQLEAVEKRAGEFGVELAVGDGEDEA